MESDHEMHPSLVDGNWNHDNDQLPSNSNINNNCEIEIENEIEKDVMEPSNPSMMCRNDNSNVTAETALIPPLARFGIRSVDLQIAIRVLDAVAALCPTKKQQKQEIKQGTKKRKDHHMSMENTPISQAKHDQMPSQEGSDNDTQQEREPEEEDNFNGMNNKGSGCTQVDEENPLQQYKHASLRSFRKALQSCLDLHQRSMYDGQDAAEYYAQRDRNRALKRQKCAEQALQQKHLASTALRKGRIDRLQALLSQQDESQQQQQQQQHLLTGEPRNDKNNAGDEWTRRAAQLSMIPDGHVETTPDTFLLLETCTETVTAAPEAASDEDGDNNNNNNNRSTEKGIQSNLLPNMNTDATENVNPSSRSSPTLLSHASSKQIQQSPQVQLPKLRSCYVCKVRFRQLHHFYDQLCPSCATLNWSKRHASANCSGKVAVVTGARVKIGFQVALKLLRAGAVVIATTRFPNTAIQAYRAQVDFDNWHHRLHVYGLDLRDVVGIEAFVHLLQQQYGTCGIDILINNACQTVRRPVGYYRPMLLQEQTTWQNADSIHKAMLQDCCVWESERARQGHPCQAPLGTAIGEPIVPPSNTIMSIEWVQDDHKSLPSGGLWAAKHVAKPSAASSEIVVDARNNNNNNIVNPIDGSDRTSTFERTGISHATAMSQVVLLPEDDTNRNQSNNSNQIGDAAFLAPAGITDINGQPLDLRTTNSWLLKMDQVSTPELMECMLVNAIAPFVLNARLKPLMTTPADSASSSSSSRPDRFIINVSAMEGKFYRYKMPHHPHTNMAKAALNMLTRTAAQDLAEQHRIYMNSVDTGWINDENPLEKASQIAMMNNFQTPIDEIDAAARILDPIFSALDEDNNNDDNNEVQGCQPIDRNDSKKEKDLKKKSKTVLYGKFLKDYRETEW